MHNGAKLSLKSKLRTAAEFKSVFDKTEKKIVAKGFLIFFCKNKLSFSRLGVIAPKKRIKKANKRNRFKRVVRENFRLNQNRLKSLDIVVLATNQKFYKEKGDLGQELANQIKRLSK